jgi:hypothetical protein
MVKCTSCSRLFSDFKLVTTDSGNYKAVAHCCPFCSAVLGAEIDPLAVRSEIIDAVKKLLGR